MPIFFPHKKTKCCPLSPRFHRLICKFFRQIGSSVGAASAVPISPCWQRQVPMPKLRASSAAQAERVIGRFFAQSRWCRHGALLAVRRRTWGGDTCAAGAAITSGSVALASGAIGLFGTPTSAVSCTRRAAVGASTPLSRWRCRRGGGIRAVRRSIVSSGVSIKLTRLPSGSDLMLP